MLSFAPLLAHSVLFEMISHPTISKLIEKEIELIEEDTDSKEVKLFVLYFLLIETNLSEEIDKIEILIEKTSLWNVHNSIFFKLLTFVAFKSNGNEILLEKLKKYLDIVYKRIDPKATKGDISLMVNNLKIKGVTELPPKTFDIT